MEVKRVGKYKREIRGVTYLVGCYETWMGRRFRFKIDLPTGSTKDFEAFALEQLDRHAALERQP